MGEMGSAFAETLAGNGWIIKRILRYERGVSTLCGKGNPF